MFSFETIFALAFIFAFLHFSFILDFFFFHFSLILLSCLLSVLADFPFSCFRLDPSQPQLSLSGWDLRSLLPLQSHFLTDPQK